MVLLEITFFNFIECLEESEKEKLISKTKLKLLINYLSPEIFIHVCECKDFESAIDILDSIFLKPTNEVYARHLLATRHQLPEETVDKYLQALNLLAKECDFKTVTAIEHRNLAIRDAFICGLISASIRQRILENNTITLEEAFRQARSLEIAQTQSQNFVNDKIINAFIPSTNKNKETCYFCGNTRHPRTECPAKNAICLKCGKRGHFAKVCKNKNKSISATMNSEETTPIHSHEQQLSSCMIISAAAPSLLQKTTLTVLINGYPVKALIDTGSTNNFIHENVVQQCKLKRISHNEMITLASNNHRAEVLGKCNAIVKVAGHNHKNVELLIMKELCVEVILGTSLFERHSSLQVDFNGPQPPLIITCATFESAKVEPVRLFEHLDKGCCPIATKSRKHTKEDEIFISQEVQNLLENGIIEESSSPWRAQVLVISNTNHRKRMVIDYSRTINKYTDLDAYPLPNIENIINKVAKYRVFSKIDLRSAYHQIPIAKEDKIYTAFEANGNLYQFTRIPFGVTNGVAAFQRTIDQIIRKKKLQGVYPYLDDITVCGVNVEDHDRKLETFMEATKEFNLILNLNKSIFKQTSIDLLGYTISNNEIKPDAERLRPLLDLPVPQDSASMKRIIGMFAHYSKWISHFSEKIRPLIKTEAYPINNVAKVAFETIKAEIAQSALKVIDDHIPFTIETDASEHTIAASLSQDGRPVAFFSRCLVDSERRHSAIEKEAYAIVESIRKWRQLLLNRPFTVITDQRCVSFMLNKHHSSKIKNEKIERWRLELSVYKYDIAYRPGKENLTADTLSRVCANLSNKSLDLYHLHKTLCHPGITRMTHWIRAKNLAFSTEDIKKITKECSICAEIKPKFFRRKDASILVKATKPLERLSIDFKGPLPSSTRNRYILTVIDEYSRFPFAFPCSDLSASTVINRLDQIFVMFGMPSFIHSDRGSSFMSTELQDFLRDKGIAMSRTTAYNPQGNGQVERYNGIIWKTIQLALKTKKLPIEKWEQALPDALHSIRSLLCTATNATPHERMFRHDRKSTVGTSLPTWLAQGGTAFLRTHHNNKNNLVEEVEVLQANPDYSHVRYSDGRETTVSNRHLAPRGNVNLELENMARERELEPPEPIGEEPLPELPESIQEEPDSEPMNRQQLNADENVRRSSRQRKQPTYLRDYFQY